MDEIDFIGSSRGESRSGDGYSEVQRTMSNQLGGFELTKNNKVVMATNHINFLDSVLLHHGRIDRKIEFPPPVHEARASILRTRSRKMSLQHGVNLRALAEKMGQCSGAEARGICMYGSGHLHGSYAGSSADRRFRWAKFSMPQSVSLHSAIQASSAQMSLDADRGSHDVSSAPGPIWEESRHQSFDPTGVGAHEPHRAVHEPSGSSPFQPAVPATAEGHSVADEENPNDVPAAPPAPSAAANPHSNPFKRSVLGLSPKYSHPKPQAPPQHDYEKKYPEDPIYEEQSENARVWRVYLDEATEFDADMVNKASDGLDLLLVFAGLFSAVLTTFVAQTSQSLSNDDAAVSVSLLSELVMIQRAMANGTSIGSIPPAETTSGPSRGDVWVNGLWFISLTLSLSTALLAVLARQWLHQYTTITSGTSRDRCLIRQYRFDGLTKWRVLILIGLLPVLLHIALGLFLMGLVIFLVPLNPVIGWTVAGITFLVYLIYVISNILPLVNPQCPYRTPFSDILHMISHHLVPSVLTSLRSLILHPSQLAKQLRTYFCHLIHIVHQVASHCRSAFESLFSKQPGQPQSLQDPQMWQSLKEVERQMANTEDVGARAIAWLLKSTSNPPTTSIALQSLAGCSPAMIEMLGHGKPPILLHETGDLIQVSSPRTTFAVTYLLPSN
ncbi:hypothetical protein EYR40_003191 [Pleurotus pulmonarius]|nr:hypothetical protein EYR40_003191 [Pleurotus pulmonarius]